MLSSEICKLEIDRELSGLKEFFSCFLQRGAVVAFGYLRLLAIALFAAYWIYSRIPYLEFFCHGAMIVVPTIWVLIDTVVTIGCVVTGHRKKEILKIFLWYSVVVITLWTVHLIVWLFTYVGDEADISSIFAFIAVQFYIVLSLWSEKNKQEGEQKISLHEFDDQDVTGLVVDQKA